MRLAMLVLIGCSAAREPTTQASGSAPRAVEAAVAGPLVVPPGGPVVLPAELVACKTDADCTVVALGCGDETPVARSHHAAVKKAYEAAGRIPGPIDDACGPGAGPRCRSASPRATPTPTARWCRTAVATPRPSIVSTTTRLRESRASAVPGQGTWDGEPGTCAKHTCVMPASK